MTKEEELEEGVVYYVTTEDRPNREWLMKHKGNGFVNLEDKNTCVNNFTYYKVDTYTKATPSQIKHYESCMKACKYIEPEEVKLEEWSEGTYVVIIEDYHSVNIGDVHKIGFNSSKECIDIEKSVGNACFPFKDCCNWFKTLPEAEEFAKALKEPIKYLDDRGRPLKEFKVGSWYSNPKITWVSLTNGNQVKFFKIAKCEVKPIGNYYYNSICFDAHADSDWNIEANDIGQSNADYDQDMVEVFPVVKSERYIKTMEFFNQLREPEKSQAIANYDENYVNVIPDKLFKALNCGFEWMNSPEGHNYWNNINDNIKDKTYFKEPEPIKEAVHCPTQEEFDYVTKKLGYEWSLIHPFDTYTTDNCIEIGFKCCGRRDDFKTYTILSFQEWCTKYNHEGLKPWVAKEGDWVYVIDKHTACYLTNGSIVQCVDTCTKVSRAFTKKNGGYWLEPFSYRKATQAEIDSVNKGSDYDIDKPQWTYNNWYVEVSSQEEADMVIEAADKMYGKTSRNGIKPAYTEDWKYVSCDNDYYFCSLNTKNLSKSAKPRPISDFITVSDSSIFPIETMKAYLRRLDKPYQQYPLTPSESFKVRSNPKLLDNNVSKISSINISLKQKSKSKKL
jgi:hypothetical protein